MQQADTMQQANNIAGVTPAQARPSLTEFVLKNRINKIYLLIALGGMFVQLIVFKWAYPFADFFTDSYTYIQAAADHATVSYRQIGYSRFLALAHRIVASDTPVVCFQYLFIGFAALYFFFSLRYFFRPAEKAAAILFVLFFFNPVFLYLSNYITSDALFVGASILWITELIWIINHPRPANIIVQAALLAIAFNLRYAALFYPLIATLAFLLSPLRLAKKALGIVLSMLLVIVSAWYTIYETWKVTGTATFSAFSGWQLANNAMHMFPHIKSGLPLMQGRAYGSLDSTVKQYMDTVTSFPFPKVSTHYMWDSHSPLKVYLRSYLHTHPHNSYFAAWTAAGPVFSNYGWALIKSHPVAFTEYYLVPNSGTYLFPYLESMYTYNDRRDTVDAMAVSWFRYKSTKIRSASATVQGIILAPFPALFLAGNIFFIITCAWVFSAKRFRTEGPAFFVSMLVMASFIVVNAAFSIFATMSILRYTVFALIMVYTFACMVAGVFLRPGRPKAMHS